MSYELPPAVKLAERILREIELAVSRWARYHKYTHGTLLRGQAMRVAQLAHRAWRDRARTAAWLDELIWAVDDLKLSLQLGKQIRAFVSFGQFKVIAEAVYQLGRQCGGWRKQQHSKGQNVAPPQAPPQRAQILSTHAPSAEGNS